MQHTITLLEMSLLLLRFTPLVHAAQRHAHMVMVEASSRKRSRAARGGGGAAKGRSHGLVAADQEAFAVFTSQYR
jgi:hypothetical protein